MPSSQWIGGSVPGSLRVLPIDARLDSFAVPRCTFSLYTYPDPGDPAMVAVDTITSDVITTQPADTAPYEELYARLLDGRAAALHVAAAVHV